MMGGPASTPRLIHELLEASAQKFPDRCAVIHEDREYSFGELVEFAGRVATALESLGVKPGDRVGLRAANSVFYIGCYYGILGYGAVVVPLNTSHGETDLRHQLDDCQASAVIVGASARRGLRPEIFENTSVIGVLTEGTAGEPDDYATSTITSVDLTDVVGGGPTRNPRVRPGDLASVVYTSGSTGRARGVMLTHANIVANTRSITTFLKLTRADRVLAVLPFYYVFGKSLLNTHVAVGGSVVIENRSMYPTVVLDTLHDQSCTGFAGVPSTYQILLEKSDLGRRALPALRYVCQAGGPMSVRDTRRLMEALPDTDIYVMYGCTEASARLSYLPPRDLADHVGSIGVAIPQVDLRVLRDDGSEADAEEIGELVARGPNIMAGYWQDPEATRSVIDDNGLHTGDLARRDEAGFLFIVGRKTEMIKSGGHRISPSEIEEVLLGHTSVSEAAVIGVPDDVLGEVVVAFVVPDAGTAVDPKVFSKQLRAAAATALPRFKVPAQIILRPTLPRNEFGKVIKRALVTEYAERGGAPR